MADMKITPAMRDWCRRLNIPTNYRLARTSYGMYRMEGVSGARPPTHPMVERLERAGLIEWSNGLRGVIHARLTAAGSSVANGVTVPAKDILPPKCAGCETRCSGCPMSHPDSTRGVQTTPADELRQQAEKVCNYLGGAYDGEPRRVIEALIAHAFGVKGVEHD